MSLLQKVKAAWKEDHSLRRVIKNTSYMFSSSTLSMPLTALQSILAARTLGVAEFGALGVITQFAANVNRLLSFRMGEPVVKYMGEFMAQGKREQAAAGVKAATLTEAVTSLATYLLLFLLAPVIAIYFIRDPSSTRLIEFYGLMLVANLIPETSTGILQVGGHYRSQAFLNLLQSVLTCMVLVWAFLVHGGLSMVLLAYFIGKVVLGAGMTGYAFYQAGKMLGPGWIKVPFKYLPEGRSFWKFAVSTNLSQTINLFARDSEETWVALLLNTTAAGYYKTAKAVMNILLMPINPFISTTYPELAKTIATRAWDQLKQLLRRLTWISFLWNAVALVVLAAFGAWLIPTVYGQEFGPAYPATMILLFGFGMANVLFWNRTLLLSLGEPNYALAVIAIAGALKICLSFLLVPRFGYLMQAGLLSAYLGISVLLIAWRGLSRVRKQQEMAAEAA